MKRIDYFFKITTSIVLLLCFVGVSHAGGGDDEDKKSNKQNIKAGIVKVNSTLINVEVEAIDQEDTLVFDDWEAPEDIGLKNEREISFISEVTSGSNSKESMLENLGATLTENLAHLVKKEYKVEFTVYPNPTVNQLNIETETIPSEIRIIDITGRMHRSSYFQKQIDVQYLPTGTYFIQLIYFDHVESRKFIKS